MNIAIKTLQNYEAGRVPAVKQLLAFAALADTLDRDDLFKVFTGEPLILQLEPPVGWTVDLNFQRSNLRGAKRMSSESSGGIKTRRRK